MSFEDYVRATPEERRHIVAEQQKRIEREKQAEQPILSEAKPCNEAAPALDPCPLVYFFDCPDAIIGERYLTAREITDIIKGAAAPVMHESEIIRAAANYEADLYRAEKDRAGEPTKETCIYSAEA